MTTDLESLKRIAVSGSPLSKAAALTIICKYDSELEKRIEEIIEGE